MMNLIGLFSEKDSTAVDTCFKPVNYGYVQCEDTIYNTIDQCGLTVTDMTYSTGNSSPEQYEPVCKAICDANPDCDFYMIAMDWEKARCTLKTYNSVMNAAIVNLDDASTINIQYCNITTPNAAYDFLPTCGNNRGCAWNADPAQFGMGAKVCSDWDDLESCNPKTPTVSPDPTEETTTVAPTTVHSKRTLPALPTMPTRPTKPTALPATTVPEEPTVAPEEPTTTVAPEEPTTTVAPEETTTAAPGPYAPTTTDSSVIPPRPDGQGTDPADEDSSSAEDSNMAAVAVGSAAAGAAGIAGAAAAYMKGGFGSSASSGMDGVENVNLEEQALEREQVAEVDLDMFA